jgi:two-component system, chemotaxis family, response regulator WspF
MMAAMMVAMIRVAIANDTLMALEALRRMIATEPAYQLIWTAQNGAQAVAQAARDRPDLILMDLRMPGIDGVEATRQIMARSPCAILIVTGSIHGNTSKVFEAMGCGALDVVQTPVLGPAKLGQYPPAAMAAAAQPLLAKMTTVAKLIGKFEPSHPKISQKTPKPEQYRPTDLIVIGASTGGPKALAEILAQLPESLSAAIVIIQHIDVQFAAGLADWLKGQSVLPVALAMPGDRPQPGKVLIAQAHSHLVMRCDRKLAYLSQAEAAPFKSPYCPSIDVFFKSVAQYWPLPGQAVLLTGMGRDGAVGLGTLRTVGWQTIAESEQSCVVYGMPRAAAEMGAASSILALHEIAPKLIRHR